MGKASTGGTGDRFRQIADTLFDGNKSELARSLGMQPSSFAKYTDGRRRPGSKILERLSHLGVNINWFLSGEGTMMDGSPAEDSPSFTLEPESSAEQATVMSSDRSDQRFFQIPIIRFRDEEDQRRIDLADGVACLSESFIHQHYGVAPQRLREFRASGNAMTETICPGDRLLLEMGTSDSLVDGQIYVIGGPAGVLIRRVTLQGESIVLVADNPNLPPQEISREEWAEAYRPIARVLEVLRSL